MSKTVALTATLSLLLAACGQQPAPKTSAAPTAVPVAEASHAYRDPAQGFSLDIPPGMQLRHDFQRSYLDAGAWKAFAEPDSQGTPMAALVLDGSNKITAAELRIGVSADHQAVAHCTEVPASGVPAGRDTVKLSGTDFVHFHAADAAMSHYLQVESYRAVHAGRCYALDLWISGTRPEVYDPPATPPFSRKDALRSLHDALAGFHFTD